MSARRGRAGIAAVILAALAVGCGDETRYEDRKIVEQLHLEKSDGKTYVVGNNPFCVVDDSLLNDSDEVGDAIDEDRPVVASREGNVGVVGEVLPREDCRDVLRKRLDKLDPAPEGD
jgi:hypothetical protein